MAVEVLPLIGRSPRRVAPLRQWISRRAQPQDVQQEGLVVTFPPIFKESAFGLPAVGDRGPVVLGPLPIDSPVEQVGEGADLTLIGRVRVKIGSSRQGASYK